MSSTLASSGGGLGAGSRGPILGSGTGGPHTFAFQTPVTSRLGVAAAGHGRQAGTTPEFRSQSSGRNNQASAAASGAFSNPSTPSTGKKGENLFCTYYKE